MVRFPCYQLSAFHMLVKDEVVKLLDVGVKSGTAKKTGQPYSIPYAIIGDDEYNRLPCGFADSALIEGTIPQWILDAKGKDVVVSLEIKPKGFDLAMRIIGIATV